jgi:pyruvate kinase
MRKAKIVCTIGPSSSSKNILSRMIKAGMNVARLNFSHGSYDEHKKVVGIIRACEKKLDSPVAIMQDLQGLKIRVGPIRDKSAFIKKDSELILTARRIKGDSTRIQVGYSDLVSDVSTGDTILIDDGLIQLKVIRKEKESLVTKVIEGGLLRERKGVNLPGSEISGAVFTKKDREDLEFGVSIGVDYVAMSFVRSRNDILSVKRWLRKFKADIPVIAKIERPQALVNIDEIIGASDGLMIARGDLGVEVQPEKVPLIQKDLIKKCNAAMKPVITATQMLESMTEHMRPTRAEAADVANAVLDGTDALMLSAETSIGRNPVRALKMMDRIISHTESEITAAPAENVVSKGFSQALAEAAYFSAEDIGAKTIVAFSRSGFTALLVSKFRPRVPVTCFTAGSNICRKVCLYWGVSPHIMKFPDNTDEMINESEKTLLKKGIVKKRDHIVIIASSPFALGGKSNILKLHKVSR